MIIIENVCEINYYKHEHLCIFILIYIYVCVCACVRVCVYLFIHMYIIGARFLSSINSQKRLRHLNANLVFFLSSNLSLLLIEDNFASLVWNHNIF